MVYEEWVMRNGFVIKDTMKNGIEYAGTTAKFGVTIDNENYIVKLAKDGYKTSLYSEHLASRFIRNIGIICQETWLGYYTEELVVIMKDFASNNFKLKSFISTEQSSEDTDLEKYAGYTYSDILHLIEKHSKMNNIDKEKSKQLFWRTFLCDAILGNRDRHGGNWGYLTNGKVSKPAPIFDNGGSLFPDVEKVFSLYYKDKYKFIIDRSNYFPASIIKRKKGDIYERINYYDAIDYLGDIDEFKNEFNKFRKIGLDKISSIAYNTLIDTKDIISKDYLNFYYYIICTRYLRMIQRYNTDTALEEINRRIGHGKI